VYCSSGAWCYEQRWAFELWVQLEYRSSGARFVKYTEAVLVESVSLLQQWI